MFITGHDRSVLSAEHRNRPLVAKPYSEGELREKLAACRAAKPSTAGSIASPS